MKHGIEKTEVDSTSVSIKLANGIAVHLSSNPGYLHIHFSGIEDGIAASAAHNTDGIPDLELANYVDISYKPRE